MSRITQVTGVLAGVSLILLLWLLSESRQSELRLVVGAAAVFVGFSVEHSAGRIVDTVREKRNQ